MIRNVSFWMPQVTLAGTEWDTAACHENSDPAFAARSICSVVDSGALHPGGVAKLFTDPVKINSSSDGRFITYTVQHPSLDVESASIQCLEGSMYTDPEFIAAERRLGPRTIAFDLHDTLGHFAPGDKAIFIPWTSLISDLQSLKEQGFRLVLWTQANRVAVTDALTAFPELACYFDLAITRENFYFSDQTQAVLDSYAALYQQANASDREEWDAKWKIQFNTRTQHIPKDPSLLGYRLLAEDSTNYQCYTHDGEASFPFGQSLALVVSASKRRKFPLSQVLFSTLAHHHHEQLSALKFEFESACPKRELAQLFSSRDEADTSLHYKSAALAPWELLNFSFQSLRSFPQFYIRLIPNAHINISDRTDLNDESVKRHTLRIQRTLNAYIRQEERALRVYQPIQVETQPTEDGQHEIMYFYVPIGKPPSWWDESQLNQGEFVYYEENA